MDLRLVLLSIAATGQIMYVSVATAADVTLRTRVGTLIGVKEDVSVDGTNYTISKFLGIPYAEPPVGARRFRFPVAKAAFRTPKIVNRLGSRCLEENLSVGGSEDCLFLNVHAPERKNDETFAVMVYIHGGAFTRGTSGDYEADTLAAYGHVIVVTINYRLSVWGFLSTNNSDAHGNFGLWDQRLAIEWVKNNIGAFGGDSNRITIFGESAGAASVIYQGMFPRNKGRFQRIIAQSGSASSSWALTSDPRPKAEALANATRCNKTTIAESIDCLRNLNASTIQRVLNNVNNNLQQSFVPTVDNVFVTCRPGDILSASKDVEEYGPSRDTLASFDLMIGMNAGEGGYHFFSYYGVFEDGDTFMPNKSYFDTVLVPMLVNIEYGDRLNESNIQMITNAIIEEYTDEKDPQNPLRIREQFVKMYTDVEYRAPLHSTVNIYTDYSSKRSYVYHFNVDPPFHILPTTPSWFKRASHADELIYLFPLRSLFPFLKDRDKQISKVMMTLWTNFAKTGNPNLPNSLGFSWPYFTSTNRRYLDITQNMTSQNVKTGLGEEKAEFWNTEVAKLVSYDDGACAYDFSTAGAPRVETLSVLFLFFLISLVNFIH